MVLISPSWFCRTRTEVHVALFHLDDDLAFRASFFDVGHGLVGRFEGEDPVHDRLDDPGLDERSDLAELIPACPHEEERIAHLATFGRLPDPMTQNARYRTQ